MRIALNPIMVGLLAATLPFVPAHAAERGQILVNDPAGNTHVTLDNGDTVTYGGNTGGAIDVTGAGNHVQGAGVTVTANEPSDPLRFSNRGVRARDGATVSLTGSTVKTLGQGQFSDALEAYGAGTLITVRDSDISTRGELSSGASATAGARIVLQGGSVTTTRTSSGLMADGAGSSIEATDVTILSEGGNSGTGALARLGGRITLNGGTVTASGSRGYGLATVGANAWITATNVVIQGADSGMGLEVRGGHVEIEGGSISGRDAVALAADGTGSGSASAYFKARNTTITATGRGRIALNINAPNAAADLEGVSLSAIEPNSMGVWLPSTGTVLVANRFDITAASSAVDNRRGHATLTNGTLKTLGMSAPALYLSRLDGGAAWIHATHVDIETLGYLSAGAQVSLEDPNSTDLADITLRDSRVSTQGTFAYGLSARGRYASLSAINSDIKTTGADATGLLVGDRADTLLDNSRLTVEGERSQGIWSSLDTAGAINTVVVRNGTQINTQDGVGLLASGADHTFLVSDSSITARTAGNADTGVLLHSRAAQVGTGVLESGQVTLDATRATLTGDVLADSGAVDVALKSGSVLNGALVQRGSGRVGNVTVDNASTWNMRASSTATTLANAGTVAFAAPAGGTGFKTLTVNQYAGGGTLVLNTWLGADASPTDKLVIDGGTASGNTALRILNAGGAGGETQVGIRVVETINGGTTAADAFHLDAGSTGYRASADTVSVNGYDYSLMRGGNGGAASDWYLASQFTGTSTITPSPDPTAPGNPVDPGNPAPPIAPPDFQPVRPAPLPGGKGVRNVSPESGAYLGNRLASARFMLHALHDRTPSYDGACASDSQACGSGRRLWSRVEGRQDSGLRLAQGRVAIDTDSRVMQLGGDLIHAPLGSQGSVYAGLMGGYGDARNTSTSTLTLPGGGAAQVRARGKVSGYSLGAYGTFYQNDATRMGAYADTWLQAGRYANQLDSELGTARYHSTVLSASLEAGYAVAPFAPGSALGPVVVEPQAQLVYSRYRADTAALQGTRMNSGNDNAWNARVGVRLYPQAAPNAPAVRPFLEVNWLHGFGNASVNMGPNTLDATPSRNSLQLKLGAEGRVGRAVQVSGHVFGQAGNDNQRGYGGMLNLSYRW